MGEVIEKLDRVFPKVPKDVHDITQWFDHLADKKEISEDQLHIYRQVAVNKMKVQAIRINATAIIDVDIKTEMRPELGLMLITATGTAVTSISA